MKVWKAPIYGRRLLALIVHAADRANHKNEIVFLEVLEAERIIFQYLDPVHNIVLTVFAEEGGKARPE